MSARDRVKTRAAPRRPWAEAGYPAGHRCVQCGGLVLIVVAALWLAAGAGSPVPQMAAPAATRPSAASFGLAMVFVLLTYGGWNEAAYMSEIVRAGIMSVSHGQTEAASALGLKSQWTLRLVVLPQALRVMIPPMIRSSMPLLR